MTPGPCAPAVTSNTLLTRLRRAARAHACLAAALVILAALFFRGNENVFAQQPAAQYDDILAQAAAARQDQNIPLALSLYSEAVRIRPDSKEGWFYLGLLQYGANAFPAAIDAFNHFLKLDPNAVPPLALRGLSEFEIGSFDDALRDLETSLNRGAASDPRNGQIIRYHLAQLLVRARRFDDAVTQYQYFAARHIDNPDLELGLGLAGMRMPILPTGIAPGDRALVQAVGAAGMALLANAPDTAEKQFNDLFARYPKAHEVSIFYGRLLFRDSPELAIAAFRNAVERAPTDAYAHAMLAFTLMITGHYAEAAPEAERALAAAPGMEMAQLALGCSLANSGGDMQRALAMLNKVLQQDPNNMEAHMALAALYSRAGRRDDAYRERMFCLRLESLG